MTYELNGKSVLGTSWSIEDDPPIFLVIFAYLSMSSNSSWCIYLFSSFTTSTSAALCESACSFSLGPTTSINAPFSLRRTLFSCRRLHTSMVSFFFMSSISANLASRFLDDSSYLCVVWEQVIVDIRMTC